MHQDDRKTIIRHLKGIVAVLEKEGKPTRDIPEAIHRFREGIEKSLDKKWNGVANHVMAIRRPSSAFAVTDLAREDVSRENTEMDRCLKDIAESRGIKVEIGRNQVVFSK